MLICFASVETVGCKKYDNYCTVTNSGSGIFFIYFLETEHIESHSVTLSLRRSLQQISNKCLSCCSQRRRRSCDSTTDTYHSWITTKQTVREKIIIINTIWIYISSPLAIENLKTAYSPTYNTNFVQKCLSRSRNLSYHVAKTTFNRFAVSRY